MPICFNLVNNQKIWRREAIRGLEAPMIATVRISAIDVASI